MATTELRFRVIEEGNVEQVVKRTEQSLQRLSKTADTVSRAQSTAATEVANNVKRSFSPEVVNGLIGPLSQALGQTSPIISQLTMGVTRFGDGLQGASLAAKVFSGGMVAIAAGAAMAMERFQEGERIATRMATISTAVRALDFGSLQGGLKGIATEFDALQRRASSFVGGMTLGFENLIKTVLRTPTALEELRMAQQKTREGLASIEPHRSAQAQAEARGVSAGLFLQADQFALQRSAATGTLVAGDLEMYERSMRGAIEYALKATIDKLEGQRREALSEANAARAIDIMGPRIQEQFDTAIDLAVRASRQKGMELGEYFRQTRSGMGQRSEQSRASLAQSELERARAGLDSQGVRAAQEEMARTARNDRRTAMGMGVTFQDFNRPEQMRLIQDERNLTLATIEETLTAKIAAYNREGATQEERIRNTAAAQSLADAQRQAAINQAYLKEQQLTMEMSKQREAAIAAGQAIQEGITSELERARSAAESLSSSVGSSGSGVFGGGSMSPGSIGVNNAPGSRMGELMGESGFDRSTINEFARRYNLQIPESQQRAYMEWGRTGDLSKQAEQRSRWTDLGNASWSQTWAKQTTGADGGLAAYALQQSLNSYDTALTGGDVPSYDVGGVIPGPKGRPQLAIVHGEEEVLTPEQRRSGGRGVNINSPTNITINGSTEDAEVLARRVARTVLYEQRRLVSLGMKRA